MLKLTFYIACSSIPSRIGSGHTLDSVLKLRYSEYFSLISFSADVSFLEQFDKLYNIGTKSVYVMWQIRSTN